MKDEIHHHKPILMNRRAANELIVVVSHKDLIRVQLVHQQLRRHLELFIQTIESRITVIHQRHIPVVRHQDIVQQMLRLQHQIRIKQIQQQLEIIHNSQPIKQIKSCHEIRVVCG